MVQGVGCRVQGAGCRVQGAGCRVQGAGCKVQGAGCRVQGAGCRMHGAGCFPLDLRFDDWRLEACTSIALLNFSTCKVHEDCDLEDCDLFMDFPE